MQKTVSRQRLAHSVLATCALTLGLVGLTAAPALAAPVAAGFDLAVTPTADVGDTVDVQLDLTGVTDVYAYELTLAYDPALFDYVEGSATGPEGGYDIAEAQPETGAVTLIHTRLGSSPALAGDISATLQLTAISAGEATLTASGVLIDTEHVSTTLADTTPAAVTVIAAPVDPADPDDGGGGPGNSPSPSATPLPAGTDTPSGSDPLATTGFDALPYAIAAVALITVGALVARRRIAGSR
ncbi:hypothetical protein GCM10027416_19410 [Okibacterium endophyticum]